MHQYYVIQIVHRPWYRQEGYQKLVAELNSFGKSYNKIVITNTEANPTIFLLFYNQYDPSKIQKVIEAKKSISYGEMSFSKYQISSEQCPLRAEILTDMKTGLKYISITGDKGVLYVDDGTCKITDNRLKIVSQIRRADNNVVFQLVTVK